MKLKHFILSMTGAGVGVTGMLSAQAPAAADLAAARRVIDAQNQAWVNATKRGDAAAIANIFADSGSEVRLRAGVIKQGRAAIQALFSTIYEGPHATAAVVKTEQLILDGRTAVEYGHYRFTYPPKDGKTQTDSGKYVVVWRKQADGSWRILMDMGVPQ